MGMMEWLGNAEYFAPLTESGNRKSGFNAEARRKVESPAEENRKFLGALSHSSVPLR